MKSLTFLILLSSALVFPLTSLAFDLDPPEGVTSVFYNYGNPFFDYSANIYIWYDASEDLFIHIDPIGEDGMDLSYCDLYYFDSSEEDWDHMGLADEYSSWVNHEITSPETYYLKNAISNDIFPLHVTTNLRFDRYSSEYLYVTWPDAFNAGDPYPEACQCDDTDNDGVPDAWDECADTPADSTVNATGCPSAGGKKVVVVPLMN